MVLNLWSSFAPLAAIAPTPAGLHLLQPWAEASGATLWRPTALGGEPTYERLRDRLPELWQHCQALVFAMATGAVVRLIAPLLENKATDPAVVVLDETGRFVISLVGGHQAGADQLTQQLAAFLNAQPVLTGAAQAQGWSGLDCLGVPFGWRRGTGDWTAVSGAIARNLPLHVDQDAGSTLWRQSLPNTFPLIEASTSEASTSEASTSEASTSEASTAATVRITAQAAGDRPAPTVYWHPRVLWLGVGCERGTPAPLIEQAIEQGLTQAGLSRQAVAGIASLDLKADEPGLLAVCQAESWPLHCFPAAELQAIPVPNPSAVVAQEVGTPSVAEAAALRVCQAFEGGQLRLPKQIVRSPDSPGAVTVAIAQAQQEYSDRPGHLLLIGSGPGSLEQLTPAARSALVAADVVIGYGLYLDLLQSLQRPGQIFEASPITQERQRAERAIALAQRGLRVAVVSSGDCGIYGMAGLVLECLARTGWDGSHPMVDVIPGISALQAAASRVGAPLMHDFCAISLSDLLTPWPVIEQRLEAAARADFVIALYNPRSGSRTHPFEQALTILRRHRSADTPVALVRAVYRAEEVRQITRLSDVQSEQVDMLTIVVIGNQSSFVHRGWMITPRGYLGNT